ncbi:acetylornithine transaminase [Leuconostocaceae bacterium ESL0723]|nr:acetylornithine transaminase [Leuconostocaceae bacterium ESL0723]
MSKLMNTYTQFPIEIDHGHDFHLVDTKGKTYVDLTSGIGVCNLGYSNKAIFEAVTAQLNKIWHTSNLYPNSIVTKVAEELAPDGYQAFFCNSGAEANEAAIKLAHKATKKETIVAFDNGFHGRTTGTLAVTGYPHIHSGFDPLMPAVKMATYNDPAALDEIDENTAAVILEVIQGEGGVNVGDREWLQSVQAKCQDTGTLLIVDEVQAGMGRTGYKFAFEQFDLVPDIITVAKGLANGLPVGAMVAKDEVAANFKPGDHGTTFGGNLIVMSAADQVLQQLTPEFLQSVREKGAYLMKTLHEYLFDLPGIKSISGEGLMVGIHLDDSTPVNDVITALQDEGFLTLSARGNTLRLLPPLIIDESSLQAAVNAIASAVDQVEEMEG